MGEVPSQVGFPLSHSQRVPNSVRCETHSFDILISLLRKKFDRNGQYKERRDGVIKSQCR